VGIKFRSIGKKEGAVWREEEGLATLPPWNILSGKGVSESEDGPGGNL
jgi:hypothetical protein